MAELVDSYTKLLLHFDGVDNATTTIDESGNNHITTLIATAKIDTAQKVFGPSSLLLDGNSDWASVADSADWDLGNGDFTMECWVRFGSVGAAGFFARYTGNDNYFYLAFEPNSLRFRDFGSGGTIDFNRAWAPGVDTWYHVAVVRTGNTIKMFIDGTQIGLDYDATGESLADRSDALLIGSIVIAYYLSGWIEEVRWSKGVARWTANFTPPPYPYHTIAKTQVF